MKFLFKVRFGGASLNVSSSRRLLHNFFQYRLQQYKYRIIFSNFFFLSSFSLVVVYASEAFKYFKNFSKINNFFSFSSKNILIKILTFTKILKKT